MNKKFLHHVVSNRRKERIAVTINMHKQIYYDQMDIFPYEPISSWWMIMYICSSFGFFIQLNRLIRTENFKSNWMKENTLLSFVHAFISSMLIIIGVLRAPEMFEDPLSHSNHFNYALIAFSIGYFLYDFRDCLYHSTSSKLGILFHHILVISFLSHVLLHTRNIGYALYGLSIEINSVFLHARRLVRWYSPLTNSNRINQYIEIFVNFGNYLTFLIFRFGIVFVGLRALHTQQQRLHPVVHLFTVIISSGIGILNVILFYRLIRNQGKKTKMSI